MLKKIIIVLLILWILGLATSSSMGGFVHAFLILAIVGIGIRFLQVKNIL